MTKKYCMIICTFSKKKKSMFVTSNSEAIQIDAKFEFSIKSTGLIASYQYVDGSGDPGPPRAIFKMTYIKICVFII